MTDLLSSRRTFAISLACGLMGLRATAEAQPNPAKAKLVVAVAGKTSLAYLPLALAEHLGYFKDESINVTINDFPGSARALQAVSLGAADVLSGAFENTISLQAKNQYFRAFVMQGRAPLMAFGVSKKTLPGYRKLGDLYGKKIGVSAPGTATHMLASLVLSHAGVHPSTAVFIGVGSSAGALAAIRSGQIDAICNIDPVMTTLEQRGEIRIIADSRTVDGAQEVFGGPMPSACLFAREDFVQQHGEACQSMTNAIVRSLKWLQTATAQDLTRALPASFWGREQTAYMAAFEKIRGGISLDGVMPEQGVRTAGKALAQFDINLDIDSLHLDKTYTNEFALRARERFLA